MRTSLSNTKILRNSSFVYITLHNGYQSELQHRLVKGEWLKTFNRVSHNYFTKTKKTMKTTKVIFPLTAILFAVAGAFASISSPKTSLAIQEISIRDESCEPDGFCNNTSVMTPCKYNNDELEVDLYSLDESEPVCDAVAVTGQWQEQPE